MDSLPDMDKKLVWLKDKLSIGWQRLKGSKRDPFLYLGLTATVLLLIVSFYTPSSIQVRFIAPNENPQNIERAFLMPTERIKESPELTLIERNSLAAISPPIAVTPQVMGALVGAVDYEVARREITEYVVQEGNTLWGLSEKFEISEDTIRWANDIQGSTIQPGQKLLILPVSGTLHLIRSHDTLSEIASWYKVKTEDIMEFNEISSPEQIFAGDLLIIPKGTPPASLPAGRLTPVAGSYFICPIPSPCRITQGLHYYNAIDFSNGRCEESVYAAAGGTIQMTGYNSLAGRYVRILHPNGVVTFYGHLSSIIVSAGQRVLQGQIIGYTGHTGYTIPAGPAGCHLHFEVRGARNPFAN